MSFLNFSHITAFLPKRKMHNLVNFFHYLPLLLLLDSWNCYQSISPPRELVLSKGSGFMVIFLAEKNVWSIFPFSILQFQFYAKSISFYILHHIWLQLFAWYRQQYCLHKKLGAKFWLSFQMTAHLFANRFFIWIF